MFKVFLFFALVFPIFMNSKTLNFVTIDFPPYAFKKRENHPGNW